MEMFVCSKCQRVLKSLTALQRHNARKTPCDDSKKRFQCEDCGARYMSSQAKSRHRREHHETSLLAAKCDDAVVHALHGLSRELQASRAEYTASRAQLAQLLATVGQPGPSITVNTTINVAVFNSFAQKVEDYYHTIGVEPRSFGDHNLAGFTAAGVANAIRRHIPDFSAMPQTEYSRAIEQAAAHTLMIMIRALFAGKRQENYTCLAVPDTTLVAMRIDGKMRPVETPRAHQRIIEYAKSVLLKYYNPPEVDTATQMLIETLREKTPDVSAEISKLLDLATQMVLTASPAAAARLPVIDRTQQRMALRMACTEPDSEAALRVVDHEYCLDASDARADDNAALRAACATGHLAAAQWLRSKFELTAADARARDNEALRMACANGHVLVARWLVDMFQLTYDDMLACDGHARRAARENGHVLVTAWIEETYGEE